MVKKFDWDDWYQGAAKREGGTARADQLAAIREFGKIAEAGPKLFALPSPRPNRQKARNDEQAQCGATETLSEMQTVAPLQLYPARLRA